MRCGALCTSVTALACALLLAGCPADALVISPPVDLPDDSGPVQDQPIPSASVLGQLGISPASIDLKADHTELFDRAALVARIATLSYQWGDAALMEGASKDVALAQQRGMRVVLSLSPTSLSPGRKELDVPATVRGFLFDPTSFSQDKVRRAFVLTAQQLAALQPDYLCLGTEINLLATGNPAEFVRFVSLYKEAYAAVKAISPSIQVFVTFQYESIRYLDGVTPDQIAEHVAVVTAFRPELDLLAITTYPCPHYDQPGQMPANYYAHLDLYRQSGDSVMIAEVGWGSGGCGSEEEQTRFIQLLPALLQHTAPSLTAWSLVEDVSLPILTQSVSTTGLYTTSGDPKPSLAAFGALNMQ